MKGYPKDLARCRDRLMSQSSCPCYWLERIFWSLHSYTWDDYLQLPECQEEIQTLAAWLSSYRQHNNERVLDLGCGTGTYALALAETGFDVVGIDFAPGMLKKAREKAARLPQASVVFEQADFNRELHFSTNSFNRAICVHALQCVANPPRFLREIRRLLKPEGLFLVVVKDSSQPAAAKKGKMTWRRVIFRKLKALVSKSRRVRKYSRNELMMLLTGAGFAVIEERVSPGSIALMARVLGGKQPV